MLTLKGWLTTLLFGLIVIVSLPYKIWVFPIIFLVLGSILSRIAPKPVRESSRRDEKQVIANGLISVLCAILHFVFQDGIYQELFVLSYAVAMADTASSEIGTRFGGKAYDILKFRSVKPGLSGGVSFIGSLAGLIGSLLIGVIFYFLSGSLQQCWIIISLGFVGMVIDSLLGSLIQAKYLIEGEILESGPKSQLYKGKRWADNNMINLLSIASTVLIGYAVLKVI